MTCEFFHLTEFLRVGTFWQRSTEPTNEQCGRNVDYKCVSNDSGGKIQSFILEIDS